MSTEFDVEAVFAKLTTQHKIKLLSGSGWWHTEAIPEVGVPPVRMSDGPNGVRGTQFFNGVPSSCFPSSTGLGSSFDVELALAVGKALGDEARAKAPTVNTQRSPLGGRGFESFSEILIERDHRGVLYYGVQSKGVSATIKHFVANDQEFERFSISSDVSERALREIYLKPFQIALKHAEPWALMSAYNRVNGVHVSENKRLLDDILRKEWGFKGMVMSDWIGVYSTSESIKAGLDLEMPGPTVMRGKALERALVSEKLFLSDINDRVRKVLGLIKKAVASGVPFNAPEKSLDTPEVRRTLRTAAADAISIAVIGPNAKYAMTSGGGSARLLSTYTVSPLQGITSFAEKSGINVRYSIGATSHRYLPLLDPLVQQEDGQPGALIEFWNETPTPDFTSTNPDFSTKLGPCAWSTSTGSTNCFLMDGIDETKVKFVCWMRYSTKFIPDEDGDWEIGLNIAGRANLFIDNKLLIDLSTDPQQGESFFGLGTVDVRTVAKSLKAGQSYNLELRLSNADFAARGSPFNCWGGVRLGGVKQVDDEGAIKEATDIAQQSDVAILIIGLNHDWESEGFDRTDIQLPGLTNRLVSEVLRANPNTVVVNQSGAPVSMPWIDEAGTVLQAFYGGNELGNGLADVLFGSVNPSGKLPLTFPKRLEDSPSYPSFGSLGQEHGKILYNEGIFVGYRGFEIRNLAPLFPFGYGLSYTKFEYSNLQIAPISPGGGFTLTFDLKNVGEIDGREISQVYVTDATSSLPRPIKELKGFVKTTLRARETKTLTMVFDREALGYYDDQMMHWVAEKGTFGVHVAASSADIRLSGETELKDTFTWTGL
ncbi:glycoside hydrolase family 3 protein [Infundibulicybe gibba]|nr:glycoside hydrolase family 3 protein [Infundibulicybe gibba]